MKDLELIAEGRTAQVFDWKDNNVLKLFFDWFPEEFIDLEYDMNIAIRDFPISVPKVIERVEIDGRQGIIFEKLLGDTLLKSTREEQNNFEKHGKIMSNLHFQIHQIKTSKIISIQNFLKLFIGNAKELSLRQKMHLFSYIDTLESDNKLCYYDFHPDQIMLTKNGAYLIDWVSAVSSPPSADVARTYLLFLCSVYSGTDFDFKDLKKFYVSPLFDAYFKDYTKLNPKVTKEKVYSWLLPLAAGRIGEGIESQTPFLLKMVTYLIDE